MRASLNYVYELEMYRRLYQKSKRTHVHDVYPNALEMDDFILRIESALYSRDFTSNNSIAMTIMCRDEACTQLQSKIDSVFGDSFHTNSLGGVVTCGTTGLRAFMSHSPTTDREKYVFFCFPHIAIDHKGAIGVIHRPHRCGESHACGALQASLRQIQEKGVNSVLLESYNRLDPEYSIMNKRLAHEILHDSISVRDLNLVTFTNIAEQAYCRDLEELIEKTIDTRKADYAVVSGIQIHNWTDYVAPTQVYTVVNGVKNTIDLTFIESPTPRQMNLIQSDKPCCEHCVAGMDDIICIHQTPRRNYLKLLTGGIITWKFIYPLLFQSVKR